MPLPQRRVVVTGLGCVSPVGLDVESTWEAVLAGRSGVGLITRFDATGLPCRIAAEVKGFEGAVRLGKKAARRTGLFMQYALVAAAEAMRDAGFRRADDVGEGERAGPWPASERFGTYVASGIGGFPEIVDATMQMREEGVDRISPLFIPRSLINLAAGLISIELGARGPSLCIATACAAGNHAIGEAYRAVLLDDADVMLAGGTEAAFSGVGYGGFMNMGALSKRNDDPERASRPFDRDRDGFVMGEGAGLVVLEELEHARARGARIYCEMVGYGTTTDAYHITAPSPDGEGAARCMQRALSVAGLAPADVDTINAHGTSTPINDPTETRAIRTVFGPHADRLTVSATKGVTGHLLGAAGGLEAVVLCKTLATGWVPPTANLENPDPACDLDYVSGVARKADPRVGLSNGFGFGGTNAVLVMRRWEG